MQHMIDTQSELPPPLGQEYGNWMDLLENLPHTLSNVKLTLQEINVDHGQDDVGDEGDNDGHEITTRYTISKGIKCSFVTHLTILDEGMHEDLIPLLCDTFPALE